MNQSIFENIYDKYAGILYGIALEICPDEECAEKVFIKTFKCIYDENRTAKNSPSYYIELIKLIIGITKREVYKYEEKTNFKLKQFEHTPLLQLLICNEQTLEAYCEKNNITKKHGLLVVRHEFNSLRSFKQNYNYKNAALL
jgi:hypothetical protein